MRISILTFHNAHNYGAVLQTYALKSFVESHGHCAEVLNYRNQTIEANYTGKLKPKHRARDFAHIRLWPRMLKALYYTNAAQAEWMLRKKAFNSFIEDVLLQGKTERLNPADVANAQRFARRQPLLCKK